MMPKTDNWKDKTILVAEDDEASYRLIEEILHITKAKIVWAKNGKEAVDYCMSSNPVDLVLMDIKMPVKSGYEAASQIKHIRKELPVIAQTVYLLDVHKEILKRSGCNDYLCKPLNPDETLAVLRKYIN